MKYMIPILLLLSQPAFASEINPDLPELLDKISTLCAGRWDITVKENDMIQITSKEAALGVAAGLSYPPGEDEYRLHLGFKVVRDITAQEATERLKNLEALRKQGEKIKHTQMKGYIRYEPGGIDQWALLLNIKKAEQEAGDIPEYHYKSVSLSQEYSMTFFTPNKDNKKALQYKNDMNTIYQLLKKASNETDEPE